MEFGIIPPVRTGATADPDWMSAFARHVESAGFESLVLVEHAVVISDYTSTYPYAASGRMPLPDDCRIPDPLDLMAFLAAVTDRITLATGVLVVPNHQAVVLAKRIATVDVLSKGRVRMCLGVGWMEEELRATGADPRTRGRRMDETIEAMRVLWADSGPEGARSTASSYPSRTRTRSPSRSGRAGCRYTSAGTVRQRPAVRAGSVTASSRSASAPTSSRSGSPRCARRPSRPAGTPTPSSSRCRVTCPPRPRRRWRPPRPPVSAGCSCRHR